MSLNVEKIDPLTDPRWDPFVEGHPLGWVTHTSAWARVLVRSYPQLSTNYLAVVDSSDNALVAALPLFVVESWLTGRRLVCVPFSTISDPLVGNEIELGQLLDAALSEVSAIRAKFLEVRTFRTSVLFAGHKLARNSRFKHHELKLETSLSDVKRKFHKRSIRPCIHRAVRSGLEACWIEDASGLAEFYELYVATRKRLQLPPQPLAYFRTMWDELFPAGLMEVLLAKAGETTVAALVILKYGDRFSAEVSGWDRKYSSLSSNHFILWEGVKRAHQLGYSVFDFGRTANENSELCTFKDRWGTDSSSLDFFYFPESQIEEVEAAERSFQYGLVRSLATLLPNPLNKRLGAFCYRHRD